MKYFKKVLAGLLIASISVLSISSPVFASTNTASAMTPVSASYLYDENEPIPGITVDNIVVTPQVWWPEIYRISSKLRTGTVRYITKYITPNWSKASSYALVKGESTTYSIQIGGSNDFKAGIKASGSFTWSKTFSSTVTTTIPADSSRYSKLTYQCDYARYWTTVEKRPAYDDIAGTKPAPPFEFVGTDLVDEPTDETYAIVVYQ